MRVLEFAAVAAALTVASTAYAQEAPQAPPPPSERLEYNDSIQEFKRMADGVAGRKAGPTKSVKPVPASPGDITQGREVRDHKGVVMGTIERVGTGFAVVASPAGGKVEVEFASFAKNKNGLLINMRKAKFDAIVSGTAKAGN